MDCLTPFLQHLLDQHLTLKSLQRHRDHVWMLGGEVIRRRYEDPALARIAVEKAVYAVLEEDGGPLIWPRITEQAQRSFDATCRKLYRFLTVMHSGGGK